MTVATAGRAVFFSGLTVLLGPARARPVRVHDPALGRDRRRDRRRARGRRGAHAAAGAPRDRRAADRRLRDPAGPCRRRHRRAVGAPRPPGDAPPGRGARPDAGVLLLGSPFLHVRFNAPDATILPSTVPSRAAFDRLQAEFGEGEFAPLVIAVRTTGPATTPDNVARLYDYSRRLAADPRVTRVDSLVDVDPRLTPGPVPAALRRPAGPPDRFVATGAGRHDEGRPHGVHDLHAVRPEPRPGAGARRGPARPGRAARAAGRHDRPGRRRRRGRRGRGRPRRRRLPAHRAVHRRHDLPRPVRAPPLGRPAGQGAGDEHAVDRGQLRGPGLDLPGRQPVGAPRLPAARVRRDHAAGDPVLRPVRPVDGLRGLPAHAHEGGLGPHRATTARRWRAAWSAAAGSSPARR